MDAAASPLLKGPAAHYFSKEIESGYREALEFGGVAVDEALIWECDFSTDGARARVVQALEEKRAFDAIFSNDEMACGVLQALGAKDVRVPGRVAVVGCDGLPVGTQVFPQADDRRVGLRGDGAHRCGAGCWTAAEADRFAPHPGCSLF